MPNPTPAQLAQQFTWFESMCREVRQIIEKDLPGSPTLVVLELGEDISNKLAAEYEQVNIEGEKMPIIAMPKKSGEPVKSFRYRLQGFMPFPSVSVDETEYVSVPGTIRQSDSLKELTGLIEQLEADFPQCVKFTVIRGEWR